MEQENELLIETKVFHVLFKRNKRSKTERGIAIGEQYDIKTIIDKNMKHVKSPIWNFTPLPDEGLLPIKL